MINVVAKGLSRQVPRWGTREFTHRTWVSGPPRTRISFPEKVGHGVAMALGILVPPFYIVYNIDNYRNGT